MNLNKSKIAILIGVLLVLFFVLSLVFRVALPYDSIFTGGWVKFSSNDAYYHMHYVDNLVHNFPHVTQFDPFFIYPGGSSSGGVHFFDWLLAVIIWIIGLGSPTQHLVDVVGAYFPAVLAALTVIPVFFIGKTMFNRWVGVMAAGLVAILPGEFLGRSILGFTDNHIAETFFSTVVALFLILAIKEAGAKQDGQSPMTFNHLIKRDRKVIIMPLVYSLLAGVFLGIYLITWMGALLFVFIFAVYLIIQTIVNHLRQKSSDHLGIIGFIVFLIAAIIFLPLSPDRNVSLAMVAALFIPPVLAFISRLISGRGLNSFYYPLSLVVIGVIVLGIFYAIVPATVSALWNNFLFVFAPGGGSTATTTMEMQPFLSPQGSFTTAVAWGNYTTSFFLIKSWPIPGFGLISFVILLWLSIKQRGENENLLFFLVWTLIILIATLVQRRFAYYLVVNIAVLSAYISWQIIWLAGLRNLAERPEEKPGKEQYHLEAPKKRDYYEILGIVRGASNKEIKSAFRKLASEYRPDHNPTPEAEKEFKEINNAYETLSNNEKRIAYNSSLGGTAERKIVERKKANKKPQKKPVIIPYYYVTAILAIIVVFFLVFFFNINESKITASSAPYAPSDGWEQAMTWMKDNTPEPLGDPGVYYKLLDSNYQYPASAYGVTAWWDYGYWISRIAHRLPSTNPSQAPAPITRVANLFLSQNITASNNIMAELHSSYIVEDFDLIVSKLWAVVDWAKQDQNKYFSVYYVLNNGTYTAVQVMNPDFYRTLAVRLYSFDGKAVADGSPLVVTYDDKVSGGNHYRVATKTQSYSSYKAAQDFIASQKSGNYDIIGISPFVSPIPLDAVANYRMVYSSQYSRASSQNSTIPEIKIFELVK